MPIYEFECRNCLQRFEVLLAMNSSPVKTCIYCHSKEIEKLPSLSSFQFKGNGWYITDYKSSKKESAVTEVKKEQPAAEKQSTKTNNVA